MHWLDFRLFNAVKSQTTVKPRRVDTCARFGAHNLEPNHYGNIQYWLEYANIQKIFRFSSRVASRKFWSPNIRLVKHPDVQTNRRLDIYWLNIGRLDVVQVIYPNKYGFKCKTCYLNISWYKHFFYIINFLYHKFFFIS